MKEYFSCDFETGLITRTKKYWVTGSAKVGDVINIKFSNKHIQLQFQNKRVPIN